MTLLDRVSRRVNALLRDAAALRTAFGAPPLSPVVPRPARPSSPRPIALGARQVRVRSVVRETAQATTLTFEEVTGAPLEFRPGQFFTLLIPVEGVAYRRAYSASAPPCPDGTLSITVKEVAGGRVSPHLVHRTSVGDRLELLGPSGGFVVPASIDASRRRIFIAGGSGITPIFSMLASELDATGRTAKLALIYGNGALEDVIFRTAIDSLAARSHERLSLRHVLESPPSHWDGGVGRLDADVLARELDRLSAGPGDEYFVCGPAPMIDAALTTLRGRCVSEMNIHVERFLAAPSIAASTAVASESVPVRLRVNGRERTVTGNTSQTILETALAAGEALPYSCSLGGCGACTARVVEGEVRMDEPNCLTAEERAAGKVLTCVGRPCGAVTIEVGP